MELAPGPSGKFSLFIILFLMIVTDLSAQSKDTLRVDSVVLSNHIGIENILQGSVAGLRVKSWSGTPGAQATINLRGLSLDPTDQSIMPLILVNGVPVIASPSNITGINPLSYYAPEQIERIEIIRDIDQLAAYGVQAPNGALNIVMKEGESGQIRVRGNAFAGSNFLQRSSYHKDAFYDFNTIARRQVYGDGGVLSGQNVLVDGAGTYGSYLFGLSNFQDKGVIKNTGFGAQSLFLNARYNISDRLTVRFYNNLALANRNGRYAGDYTRELTLPVIDDEKFYMDKNRNIGLVSSMGIAYTLGRGLEIKSVAGLSYEGASRDLYIPSNLQAGNIYASSAAYKRQLITVNTTLNYLYKISEALKMDMILGNEIRNIDNRLTSVNGRRKMASGGSDFVKVVTGYNASQVNALSDHEVEKAVSFYGNWKWNYKEDIKLNMVLRADGSSLYNNKWSLYPALGMHYDFKNTLRLPVQAKVAVGQTGILSRPEVYRGELTGYGNYYGGNYLGIGELYPSFADAKSVRITHFNVGLAVAILPSLNLSVDYFNKVYRDFTFQRTLPNISGTDYKYETGGSIGLQGVELNLDATWIQTRRFLWAGNFNVAAYHNNVRALPAEIENTSLAYLSALSKGDAVTSLIAYEAGRQKIIGQSEPKAFGGLTNTFKVGNISASLVMSYALGGHIITESFNSRYYADRVQYDFPTKASETPYYLVTADLDNRTIYQGVRTVENGSFLRLSRAAISYHTGSLFKEKLTDMEIFVRGDNLITISRYSGLNPEENVANVRKTDLSATGTPLPSSIAVGLKLIL